MTKRYKLSKYNFQCLDAQGNILFINFMVGIKSLVLVKKNQISKFKQVILNNECLEETESNKKILQQLLNIGLLVKYEENEDALYDARFYRKIFFDSWQLIIMPTHRCNFKCKYCYENSEFSSVKDMSLEEQKRILKYIQKNARLHSKLRVSWFGGEPLLAVKAIKYMSEEIVKICDKSNIRYDSEMTTNGYNLTPEVFDMLYQNKIYIYQITLDGTKTEHDKQRVKADGSETFDRIFNNLLYIRDNDKKYKFARITIRTNVTRDISKNINKFLDMYNHFFASDPRFSLRFIEAFNYEQNAEHTEERLMSSDYIDRDEFLEMVYDIENREKMMSINDIISMFTPFRSICYAACKDKYTIDARLNVCKCTVHFEDEKNKIGYIDKNGDMIINEILDSKWYVRSDISKHCRNCYYLPCCNRTGCPLKYNEIDEEIFKTCHIEKIAQNITTNLQRLAKHISPILLEMEE